MKPYSNRSLIKNWIAELQRSRTKYSFINSGEKREDWRTLWWSLLTRPCTGSATTATVGYTDSYLATAFSPVIKVISLNGAHTHWLCSPCISISAVSDVYAVVTHVKCCRWFVLCWFGATTSKLEFVSIFRLCNICRSNWHVAFMINSRKSRDESKMTAGRLTLPLMAVWLLDLEFMKL